MRLPPMKDEELNAQQEEIIAPFRKMGADFNVARAMVRHPRALAAFRVWATYTMIDKNALAEREREIVAMRTAFKIQAPYVWSRHISYGQKAGLTDAEMAAIKQPIEAHAWSDADLALLRTADALVSTFYVPDEIWAQLTAHFNDEQCMDAIYCCGHFCLLGMFLNTAGVPLDPDVPYDPDLDRFK
jgi:alkylhydroperoxidase family enzyme